MKPRVCTDGKKQLKEFTESIGTECAKVNGENKIKDNQYAESKTPPYSANPTIAPAALKPPITSETVLPLRYPM